MKVINNILDDYFSNKLVNFCKSCLMRYVIDIQVIETKKYIDIRIKEKKYNDEQFKSIFCVDKKYALEYLCSQEETHELLLERAQKYLKN